MSNFVRAIAALAAAAPLFAQYGGPAILARGQAPGAMAPTQIDFRPLRFVLRQLHRRAERRLRGRQRHPGQRRHLSGSRSISESAALTPGSTPGVGLNYSSGFTHYKKSLLRRHQLAEPASQRGPPAFPAFHPQLQQQRRYFTVPTGPLPRCRRRSISTPARITSPPTISSITAPSRLSTTVGYTVQRSARLSFSFAGDGFLTRRRSTALYGAKGIGGQGDAMYRLTPAFHYRRAVRLHALLLHRDFRRHRRSFGKRASTRGPCRAPCSSRPSAASPSTRMCLSNWWPSIRRLPP